MNLVNTDLSDDPEYILFEEYVDGNTCAKATAKSYRTTFRKLRNLLGKPIHETSQETLINVISAGVENINTQQALLNIAVIVRKCVYSLDVDKLTDQRALNKTTVSESLKMKNRYIILPTVHEFDDYIECLWKDCRYREFIVNFLIRHYYVRNKDLMFDIVERRQDTDDKMNYIWLDRRHRRCVYIRNDYKTACTYGSKTTEITDERFFEAIKRCLKCVNDVESRFFPITLDASKIGYYVQKMSLKNLGEGNLLKILINHHKDDYAKIQEISRSRGTDTKTLLQSYNISYT